MSSCVCTSGCLATPDFCASCMRTSRLTSSSRTIPRICSLSCAPRCSCCWSRKSARACGTATPFTVATGLAAAGRPRRFRSAPGLGAAGWAAGLSSVGGGPCAGGTGVAFNKRIKGEGSRASFRFFWCARVDRERVDRILHQLAERLIHHAVARDGGLTGEARRDDGEPPVRVAAGPRAGMAGVLRALVDQLELERLERGEALTNSRGDAHPSLR